MVDVLDLANRLHASRPELFEALQPKEVGAAHLLVLGDMMAHIEELRLAWVLLSARCRKACLPGIPS